MILALVVSALAAPALCDPAEWPMALRAPMTRAQAQGLSLARKERYAFLAAERYAEAHPGGVPEVDGYLVAERAEGGADVFFVDEQTLTVRVHVVFTAEVPNGVAGTVSWPLPPALVPAFRATRAAPKDPRVVAQAPRYNADVLADGKGWLVWLVPATSDLTDVPLGGYVAHVKPDGRTVDAVTPLTPVLLSVPVARLRTEKGLYAATVTTTVPDPAFVAFAATWEITLAVVTPSGTWLLGGDKACFSAK